MVRRFLLATFDQLVHGGHAQLARQSSGRPIKILRILTHKSTASQRAHQCTNGMVNSLVTARKRRPDASVLSVVRSNTPSGTTIATRQKSFRQRLTVGIRGDSGSIKDNHPPSERGDFSDAISLLLMTVDGRQS